MYKTDQTWQCLYFQCWWETNPPASKNVFLMVPVYYWICVCRCERMEKKEQNNVESLAAKVVLNLLGQVQLKFLSHSRQGSFQLLSIKVECSQANCKLNEPFCGTGCWSLKHSIFFFFDSYEVMSSTLNSMTLKTFLAPVRPLISSIWKWGKVVFLPWSF